MKAKQVYEFIQKKSLKNTIGPIGQDYKNQKILNDWLDKNPSIKKMWDNILIKYDKSENLYYLNKIFSRLLTHRTLIDSIPINININSDLEFYRTQIKEKKLKNIKIITNGNFDIRMSNIKEIINCKIETENSFIASGSDIKKITGSLNIKGKAYFINSKIEELPQDINIELELVLAKTKLAEQIRNGIFFKKYINKKENIIMRKDNSFFIPLLKEIFTDQQIKGLNKISF